MRRLNFIVCENNGDYIVIWLQFCMALQIPFEIYRLSYICITYTVSMQSKNKQTKYG